MTESKAVCISHGKDVDGLASAALVKRVTNAAVILADYGDFIERLSELEGVEELYICDLGLNNKTEGPFLDEIQRLGGGNVSYIDHHPLNPVVKRAFRRFGVNLTHSLKQCTSMLVMEKFAERLPREAGLLGAYGAITDYMDDHPTARKIIDGFDRQFVTLESTVLSHAVSGAKANTDFLHQIVDGLAKLRYPHQIGNVYSTAIEQAERIANLISEIKKKGVRRRGLAYTETDEMSTGNVANLLIGAFETSTGIAYKLKEGEFYEASLRGIPVPGVHLGEIVSRVAQRVGGSGGGHPQASGARFPKKRLGDFLRLVEKELE